MSDNAVFINGKRVISSPVLAGTATAAGTFTMSAFTAGGAINLNNQIPSNTFEALRAFLGGNKVLVISGLPAWTETVTAGGDVVDAGILKQQMRVTTAVSPDSTILVRQDLYGLNTNTGTQNLIDWDKKMSVFTTVTRDTSNAAAVAFFQIKEATTLGQIAAKGIEVKISNLAMEGFAYGTSLSSAVAMGNLTNARPSAIRIDITSAGVQFYVDNVVKGSGITTAGKFPTGAAGAPDQCMFSLDNGNTATQCDLYAGQVIIIQEI